MSLNDFLKTSDLYLTLVNEQGEKFEAGKADFVKPLNTKTVIRWHLENQKYENIHPFTYAVLHGLKEVFAVHFIRPILPDKEKILEVVY